MKKMKWITTTAAVLALSTSLAIAAPHDGAKHGGKRHGKRHGFAGERLAAKLNLNEAQKAQLKSQREAFKQQNETFLRESRDTFKAYRAAKKANDTAKVQALEPTVKANRDRMQSLRDAQRQQFLSILTAEQRAQFDALKAERGAKRERNRR